MPTRTITKDDLQNQSPEARALAAGIELIPETEARDEITARMQNGWKMLNEACPITGLPLIGKDGVKYSARCKLEVLTAGTPEASGMTTAVTRASVPSPASDDSYEIVDSSPEIQTKMATLDEQSSKMGELLLRGWKMLEAVDPAGCPLMQDPTTGRDFSVGLGRFIDEVEPPAPAPAAAPAAPEPAPTAITAVSSEQQSSKMGELLLQGWAMLEEVCPLTNDCPLMQCPQTGRKFSVALDAFLEDLEQERFADPPEPAEQPEQPAEFHTGLSDDDCEGQDASSRYEEAREQLLAFTLQNSKSTAAAPVAPSAQPAAVESATAPAPTYPSFCDSLSDDQVSKELSGLLMMGWTMLDEDCPLTRRCVLMQNPEGHKYSVPAGQFLPESTQPAPAVQPQPRAEGGRVLDVETAIERALRAVADKMSVAADELGEMPACGAKKNVELIEVCAKALRTMSQ